MTEHLAVYTFIAENDPSERITLNCTCPHCGESYQIITSRQKYEVWRSRVSYIQDIWPELSPAHREMLMTGFHPDCFDAAFPEE